MDKHEFWRHENIKKRIESRKEEYQLIKGLKGQKLERKNMTHNTILIITFYKQVRVMQD